MFPFIWPSKWVMIFFDLDHEVTELMGQGNIFEYAICTSAQNFIPLNLHAHLP
jgi:hypothetical protein